MYGALLHKMPFGAKDIAQVLELTLTLDPCSHNHDLYAAEPGCVNLMLKLLAKQVVDRFSPSEALQTNWVQGDLAESQFSTEEPVLQHLTGVGNGPTRSTDLTPPAKEDAGGNEVFTQSPKRNDSVAR